MNPENPDTIAAWSPPEERPILITPDMLVPERPKDSRVPFEKGMSYFPVLIVTLIIANIAVYLWEIATGALAGSEAVIAAGALYRENVLAGEAWRLVSAAFLHGGFDHLLGNTLFLYILGMATEHAFGLPKTAVIYLLSAVTGSLLSLAMHPGPGVGASGAIFGLMGAIAVVFYRRRADFYLRDRGIGAFVGFLAALQIFFGLSEPYVDNWAHLGGFLGGALAVLVLRPALGEEARVFSPAVRALTVAAVALSAVVLLYGGGFLAAVEAHACLELGNKPAALAAADRADFAAILGINADYAPAWGNLGLIFAYEGNYTAAIEHLEKARSLDKSQAVLKHLIAALGFELRAKKTEAANSYAAFINATRDDRHSWLAEIRFAEARLAALKRLGK
jgi:rhomboid protease GluP